jgi:hypothetical protein
MSEIKINISEESRKQVQEMNAFLTEMKATISDLDGAKINVDSFKQAGKASSEATTKLTELEKAQQKLTFARSEDGKELVKVRAETAALNAETRRQAKALQEGTAEYTKLRNELKQLQAQAKELAITEGEGSQVFIEKSAQAKTLAERLRAVDQATGDNTTTVANYSEEIQNALGRSGLFGQSLGVLIKAKKGFASAQKVATLATNNFGKALIATGIGAVVVAIGFLITAMLKMQPVVDAINRVLIPLATVMDRIVGIAQEFGTTLIGIFKGEKNFKDLKDTVSDLGDEMERAWKEGQKIAELAVQIAEARNTMIIKEAELERAFEKNRKVLANDLLTAEERLKAGEDLLKLKKDEQRFNERILDMEIEQLQLKLKQNDTDREAQKELNQLIAQRITLQGNYDKETFRIQNQINTIVKQQSEQAQKQAEAEVKRLATIAEINRSERDALKFNLDAKLKELRLNGDINKLTADELKARQKLTADYEKALEALDKQAELSLLNRVNGLLTEKQQLDQNILSLEKWAETADPENQAQINKELTFYREQLALVNEELQRSGALLPEYANAQELVKNATRESEKAFNELQEAIEAQFKSGEISAKEYYEKIAQARDKYLNDSIDGAVKMLQDILDREDISADERLKIEEDLAKAKQAVRDRELSDIKKKLDAELDAERKKEETINAIKDAGFQVAEMIATEFFGRQMERLNAELSAFQTANDSKLASDLALAQSQGATQEELEVIKAQAQERMAQKESQIRRKQAEQEKKQAIFSILINTGKAVVAALPNVILSGIAGAIGAVQLALVASRPIPEFAKGVTNFEGGLARVGEAGRELVNTPYGSFMADRDMITYLPKGTDVIPNKKTEQILEDKSLPLLRKIAKKNTSSNVNVIVKNNSYVEWAFRR